MVEEKKITLVYYPDQPIEARLVTLTPKLAEAKMMGEWWADDCLKPVSAAEPIDRYWNGNTAEIEYEGRPIAAEKVAVVTGEGEDLAVQGVMIISTGPIASILGPAEPCLLVEFLFTAPRNR